VKHRIFLLIAVIALALLPTSKPSAARFGPLQPGSGRRVSQVQPAVHPKEVPVSTEHVKQVILQSDGPEIVKHMIERVDTVLPVESDERFGPPIYVHRNQNFAGFAPDMINTSHYVTAALANFNVAAVCSTCTTTATWVGIGGINHISQFFSQTGVNQKLLKGFYEFYPDPPVYLLNVRNGDQIWTKTSIDPTNGLWLLTVQDQTTGQYFAKEFSWDQYDKTTADFVVEVLTNGPVPSFSNVYFSQAAWEDEHFSVRFFDSTVMARLQQLILINPIRGCVTANSLASRSFTVYSFPSSSSC
jgi:hypothetical protein